MGSLLKSSAGVIALLTGLASFPADAKSLQDAVRASIDFHPTVQEAGSRAKASTFSISEARGGYLPQVNLSGDGGYQISNNPSTRGAARAANSTTSSTVGLPARQVSAVATQLLFDGFRTPALIDVADAQAGSARWTYTSTGETIGLRAVQAYLDVLRNQEFVRYAEENVKEHRDLVNTIRLRAEGPGSGADTIQAESRLQLALANLETRRGDLEDAKARYIETVGEAPDEVGAPMQARDIAVPEIAEAVQTAVDNSPTVKATAKTVDAAKSAIKVAESPFYPRLDVEVGGTTGDDLSGVRGANSEAHGRLVMRYALLSGGSDLARTRRAEEEMNAAKLADAEARRQVRENVRLAVEDIRRARARLDPLMRHRETVGDVLVAYKAQFDTRRRTLLDVLDIVNERFNSRVNYYDEEIRLMLNYYTLLSVSGRLLSTLNLSVPETVSSR